MAMVTFAQSPSKRGVKMPTTDKQCKYPDCKIIFNGIGARKYCDEHRKPEYRKVLNELRAKEKEKTLNLEMPHNSNTIIQHNYVEATKEIFTCPCGEEYEITLFPNIEIYPKYCEKHRNPYQRDLLLKQLGMTDEEIKSDHSKKEKVLNEEPTSDNLDELDPSDIINLEEEFGQDLFGSTIKED